jgi:hypothetical protein
MSPSAQAPAAGYSGTPLAKKLGIAGGSTVVALGAPQEYEAWLAPLPAGARVVRRAPAAARSVHLFVTEAAALGRALKDWRQRLDPDGFLWISWPKKSSKIATDVTEDVIRELGLPMGWVDIKVCAVSEVWSGLKLVVRKELRRR